VAGFVVVLAFLLAALPSARCEKGQSTGANNNNTVRLPAPRTDGAVTLEKLLSRRKSCRSYADKPLVPEHLSQLLWAAAGFSSDTVTRATRTIPSAGGIYAVRVSVLVKDVRGMEAGTYHYRESNHSLHRLSADLPLEELVRGAYGQTMIQEAPVTIILAIDTSRMSRTYGERAEFFALQEIGYASQNCTLQADALGIGSVLIGGFDDSVINDTLGKIGVPGTVVCLIPLGYYPD